MNALYDFPSIWFIIGSRFFLKKPPKPKMSVEHSLYIILYQSDFPFSFILHTQCIVLPNLPSALFQVWLNSHLHKKLLVLHFLLMLMTFSKTFHLFHALTRDMNGIQSVSISGMNGIVLLLYLITSVLDQIAAWLTSLCFLALSNTGIINPSNAGIQYLPRCSKLLIQAVILP